VTPSDVGAVIFSWGALVDADRSSVAAIREVTVRVLGYSFPRTPEDVAVAVELPPAELFSLLSTDGAVIERLGAAYAHAYLRLVGDGSCARAGAREVLDALGQRATLVVLSSDARPVAERAIIASGFAPMIGVVVCEDEVPVRLPDPVALVEAMDRCAAHPQNVLFVVSRSVEAIAGRCAGLATVAVGRAGEDTEPVIDDLRQLVGMVAGLGRCDNGGGDFAPRHGARPYSRRHER
jgi:phosphoglycolate phosphatase-like HAD superfamily hydrolase